MIALYPQTRMIWRASSVSIARAITLTEMHMTRTTTVFATRFDSKCESRAKGRTRKMQIPTRRTTPTTLVRCASPYRRKIRSDVCVLEVWKGRYINTQPGHITAWGMRNIRVDAVLTSNHCPNQCRGMNTFTAFSMGPLFGSSKRNSLVLSLWY